MSASKFKSVLIANRGEIACRVIRACQKRGIRSIAVYSDADEGALHTRMADHAVRIGPAAASGSYMRPNLLVETACKTGADAIHPGYGFLSENAPFAELCVKSGIKFIGPSPECIRLFGDKVRARQVASAAQVPIVPGTGAINDLGQAELASAKIGYPILVKTQGGGGGMGISVAHNRQELADAIEFGRSIGSSVFGDAGIYIEKYLESVSHVEVQVFGDIEGSALHMFERDCSVQRRNQKVIEEAPCVKLSSATRANLHAAALNLVKFSAYQNAGTVEFVVDDNQNFYFIELNSRIQVEHPVTEMITGLDLVDLQLTVAQGNPLPIKQEDIQLNGFAIEARILAENPVSMVPSPGVITAYAEPDLEGVRVDSGVTCGSRLTPDYDSLICKVIAHAPDRRRACERLERALRNFKIEGLSVNTAMPLEVLQSEEFRSAKYTTSILNILGSKTSASQISNEEVAVLAAALFIRSEPSQTQFVELGGGYISNWWASGVRLMNR